MGGGQDSRNKIGASSGSLALSLGGRPQQHLERRRVVLLNKKVEDRTMGGAHKSLPQDINHHAIVGHNHQEGGWRARFLNQDLCERVAGYIPRTTSAATSLKTSYGIVEQEGRRQDDGWRSQIAPSRHQEGGLRARFLNQDLCSERIAGHVPRTNSAATFLATSCGVVEQEQEG